MAKFRLIRHLASKFICWLECRNRTPATDKLRTDQIIICFRNEKGRGCALCDFEGRALLQRPLRIINVRNDFEALTVSHLMQASEYCPHHEHDGAANDHYRPLNRPLGGILDPGQDQ